MHDNPMRRQTFSLPDLIEAQFNDLEPKTRLLFTAPEIYSFRQIILTGCGDSYIAARAMKDIFELLTGIPTSAVSAIDLARYYHPDFIGRYPNDPLVLYVSNSGSVARLGEAARFVNSFGGLSVGITSDAQSLLAENSNRILKLDVPGFESAPGIRSYEVSLIALLLLAIRIGEVRCVYTMDQAGFYRNDILNQAHALENLLPAMDSEAEKLAMDWQGFPAYEFVGAGFDYAAASYGVAKMLEATGSFATVVDSESWFHLNCFVKDVDRLGTFVVSNSTNPGASRTTEMIDAAKTFRKLAVVTDKRLEGITNQFIVPSTESQITMPLTQFVPFALFAGYVAEITGEKYGRGAAGPWAFTMNGRGVKDSAIVVRKKLLE